jgi:hypothetical protein
MFCTKYPGGCVFDQVLFWIIAVVVVIAQIVLVRSARQLQRASVEQPDGVPASTPRADLGWTLITAAATVALLGWAWFELI